MGGVGAENGARRPTSAWTLRGWAPAHLVLVVIALLALLGDDRVRSVLRMAAVAPPGQAGLGFEAHQGADDGPRNCQRRPQAVARAGAADAPVVSLLAQRLFLKSLVEFFCNVVDVTLRGMGRGSGAAAGRRRKRRPWK